MKRHRIFSLAHVWAIIKKEAIQMRRDRLTFALMIGIPIIQLILFGYAINANPRHLPTAIVSAQHNAFTRALETGLKNTQYFNFKYQPKTIADADSLMLRNKVLFILSIPPHFQRDLVRGQRPQILLTADATDAMAAGNAESAANVLMGSVFNELLRGNLKHLVQAQSPVDFVVHNRYNPENITSYFIVPGLMGVTLTLILVMITSLAITREYERGTIETLLSTPIQAIEVMCGTIVPYIFVAYVQIIIILVFGWLLFGVPMQGSVWLLLICSLPFVAASLSIGITISAIARTQLQATQMTIFFFLPSILLSGFMFPFYGMPVWAQYIGDILPITYYLRIVRAIMLKGADFAVVIHFIWPQLIIIAVVLGVGVLKFRRTLD